MTWEALFERAAGFEVSTEEISATLEAYRSES